jgi:hypothetical protein
LLACRLAGGHRQRLGRLEYVTDYASDAEDWVKLVESTNPMPSPWPSGSNL